MRDDRERLADMLEMIGKIEQRKPADVKALKQDDVLSAAMTRWASPVAQRLDP